MDVPVDPRTGWGLAAPGRLPRTADLEPLVTRVLAPNPSGMTLDGTNTYVVGDPGSGQAVLVDPGPDDPAHLAAVESALAARDARCVAVLVTHHHGDHAEAALPWGAHFAAEVAAARADVAGPRGRVLSHGDRLPVAGTTIVIRDATGADVATIVTDAAGRFHVALAAGTYTVVGQHVEGLMGNPAPLDVDVAEGDVTVELLYDTGIR